MDRRTNPYSPGAGLRPAVLAGRTDDIEAFEILADRSEHQRPSRSIILTGLRGVGKTVLLQELAARADQRGWVTARVEADAQAGTNAFPTALSRSLATSLRQARGRPGVTERLKAALRTVTSFSVTFSPDGSVSLGLDSNPQTGRADSGSLYADLTDLALDLAAAAADLGVGVAVFIDEMQDLDDTQLSAVCRACHEAGQRSAPFYVIGGGLPNLPAKLATAESYAERLFEYRTIDRLDTNASIAALRDPAIEENITWTNEAIEHIVTQADGYPYFLQQFGQTTWNEAGQDPIVLADAQQGVIDGFHQLDTGFFRARWDRATPAQRDYLRAMAEDNDAISHSGTIAERLDKPPSALGPARAELIAKGLIYAPEHGRIAFTVPGMAAHINRRPDLDDPKHS